MPKTRGVAKAKAKAAVEPQLQQDLRAACQHGAPVGVVAALLQRGANPNLDAPFGSGTALHAACFFGLASADVVAALLQAGADATLPNRSGWTPVENAVAGAARAHALNTPDATERARVVMVLLTRARGACASLLADAKPKRDPSSVKARLRVPPEALRDVSIAEAMASFLLAGAAARRKQPAHKVSPTTRLVRADGDHAVARLIYGFLRSPDAFAWLAPLPLAPLTPQPNHNDEDEDDDE